MKTIKADLLGAFVLLIVLAILSNYTPSVGEIVIFIWMIIATAHMICRSLPMELRTGWVRASLAFAGTLASGFIAPLFKAFRWEVITPAHILVAIGIMIICAFVLNIFFWLSNHRKGSKDAS